VVIKEADSKNIHQNVTGFFNYQTHGKLKRRKKRYLTNKVLEKFYGKIPGLKPILKRDYSIRSSNVNFLTSTTSFKSPTCFRRDSTIKGSTRKFFSIGQITEGTAMILI